MASFRQGAPPTQSADTYAELTVTVPASPDAGISLRRAVRSLDRYCGSRTVEDLELLVTELATNGVKHAEISSDGNRITLDARLDPHMLRVEVRDRGAGFVPEPRREPFEPGGWGLMLVEGIAERWGVKRDPTTTVWFELPRAA
jgi:anti-sigma regulatory factor (Ser/Thr protein kinase)